MKLLLLLVASEPFLDRCCCGLVTANDIAAGIQVHPAADTAKMKAAAAFLACVAHICLPRMTNVRNSRALASIAKETREFDASLQRKMELSKSNTCHHEIHPIEAAEVDAKLAEAAAKKKKA